MSKLLVSLQPVSSFFPLFSVSAFSFLIAYLALRTFAPKISEKVHFHRVQNPICLGENLKLREHDFRNPCENLTPRWLPKDLYRWSL